MPLLNPLHPRFLLLLFLALVDFYSVIVVNSHSYNEEGWKAAGEYMSQAIDESADACEDFYQFSCGTWQKTYNNTYKNEADRAIDVTIKYLMRALDEINPDDPKTPKYQKRLKTFYQQCINATEDDEQVLEEIFRRIGGKIGPMPLVADKYNQTTSPYRLMGQMQQYFNTTLLVSATVEREEIGCGFGPIMTLYPAGLQKRNRVSLNSTLTKWLVKKVGNGKAGETLVLKRIEELIKFETEVMSLLENVSFSTETHLVDKIPFDTNSTNGGGAGTSWSDYFQGLLPEYAYKLWLTPAKAKKAAANQKAQVLATTATRVKFGWKVGYFRKLDDLIGKYGVKTMLDYAYWRAMKNYLTYFLDPPQYYELKNMTYEPIERQCIDYVLHFASAAAAKILFKAQGSDVKAWKYDVELIVQAVMSAFRYTIYNTDILELDDKVKIMNKLKTITIDSGVPEWLLNDQAVEQHTPNFDPSRSTFENDLRMFQEKFLWKMRSLWANDTATGGGGGESNSQPDALQDPEPLFIPHAEYMNQRMMVSLGALLPPLYNVSYPLALKFGSLGAIVGEQLMRAFDPDESHESMSVTPTAKNVSIAQHEMKKFCYMKTLSECVAEDNDGGESDSKTDADEAIPDKKCTGRRLKQRLNELTADAEGMKLAYMAYAFMVQTVGREPPLPYISDYDADQLFFLSYSRFVCGNPQMLKPYLSHFPAFGKAFQCSQGDQYYPNLTCSLWFDVSDPFIARRNEE